MKLLIRPASESDLVYVKHSWSKSSYGALKSMCYHSSQAAAPLHSLYDQLFRPWQQRILSRSSCVVAANPEDPDQLMGYCIYESGETPILHYVQVKTDFWRQGVARTLLKSAGISQETATLYSFGTTLGTKNIPKSWTYVPFYLQTQLEKR